MHPGGERGAVMMCVNMCSLNYAIEGGVSMGGPR